MTKVLIAVVAVLFVLSSCKKDYTCACSIGGQEISSSTINDTKANAKKQCDEGDATIFTITTNCEIK
ncbi:MAG: hypothetical protein NWR50_02365 [Crocinitomicaceae bacterium]|jgi:hypothetical protein|nr:hypothetical protein [Crocinitomicaceae bacterium]